MTMRVLFVHRDSRHSLTGEDVAARQQADALRRSGCRVEHFPAPDSATSRWAYAKGRNASLTRAIKDFKPDVIHLHKWFPDIGRHDFDFLGTPSVATVHNFRPLCPVGTLFRDGKFCSSCVDRQPWPLILHSCHADGRVASLTTAVWRPMPGDQHPFFKAVDRFVVPSERAASIFCEYGGVAARRMDVIPSFIEAGDTQTVSARRGLIFVGQLEKTKGILELIAALPEGEELTVIGGGSLDAVLRENARGKRVNFRGVMPREEVLSAIGASEILVFASSYLETQGLVVGEAAMMGTPVVALAGTAGADQVREHKFGKVVPGLTVLDEAIRAVRESWSACSEAGSAYWEEQLQSEVWVPLMLDTYQKAITERAL